MAMDSWIAKQEGKKHQASIGDVREIRKLVFIYLKRMVRRGYGRWVREALELSGSRKKRRIS